MSVGHFIGATICVAFLLASVWSFRWALHALSKARKSVSWPSTDGTIERSEIEEFTSTDDGVVSRHFAPKINYSYLVDGRSMSGNVIAFGQEHVTASRKFAQRYCERYPVNKRVSVHYDPNNSQASVLEPGVSPRSFIPAAFCIGFALAALASAFVIYRFPQ